METIKPRGGAREGAGRKPKASELLLIERLSPMDDIALERLKILIENGDFNAIKLFFEYRYGKPKQVVESDSNVNITGINLKDIVEFK